MNKAKFVQLVVATTSDPNQVTGISGQKTRSYVYALDTDGNMWRYDGSWYLIPSPSKAQE